MDIVLGRVKNGRRQSHDNNNCRLTRSRWNKNKYAHMLTKVLVICIVRLPIYIIILKRTHYSNNNNNVYKPSRTQWLIIFSFRGKTAGAVTVN